MLNGCIFNTQKYSVHDGPGIRTTVFMKGCPLHCLWCHNPEGISKKPQVVVRPSRCIGCNQCAKVCPHSPAPQGSQSLPLRPVGCNLCGLCVENCPTSARQIAGNKRSVSEVMQSILQDQLFYDESGGGVTFSGGEPLLQAKFLTLLLQECKKHQLHTAVDTCGLAPQEQLLAIAPFTDVFLYDLKLMDNAKHRHFTGASNHVILSNLTVLGPVAKNIWIRVPLIPTINTDQANLEKTARFASKIPNVRQVNLLPFHHFGINKTHQETPNQTLADIAPPTESANQQAAAIFESFGLTVRIGG